jgi:hypothetical protein
MGTVSNQILYYFHTQSDYRNVKSLYFALQDKHGFRPEHDRALNKISFYRNRCKTALLNLNSGLDILVQSTSENCSIDNLIENYVRVTDDVFYAIIVLRDHLDDLKPDSIHNTILMSAILQD